LKLRALAQAAPMKLAFRRHRQQMLRFASIHFHHILFYDARKRNDKSLL
jgi:hypothetical protein